MNKVMIRMKYALGLGLVFAISTGVYAIGVGMRFVDITVENVSPGASFNLRQIRNLPLIVTNQDDVNDTDVAVEVVSPNPNEMKEGYEPIPDPAWIKVLPDRYHLGPKASASSDILVQVPDDPKLIGHHYEAIIWVHTDPKKKIAQGVGMVIQTGLRSRFRMSIGTLGPASLQREKDLKKLATINTNFSISPDNLFVQGVPLGKPVDLKSLKKASLKVINEADDPIKLKLVSIAFDENLVPQAGYVYAPDPTWLTVSPEIVETGGNTIKEMKLTVQIPDKPEYRNKKYMFLVRTTLAGESLPLAYNNMVYITTEP
jgi:hypothetical protein